MNTVQLHVTLADPHDTGSVQAYCRLAEMHLHLQEEKAVLVFYCWRSEEAFESNKERFTSFELSINSLSGKFSDAFDVHVADTIHTLPEIQRLIQDQTNNG